MIQVSLSKLSKVFRDSQTGREVVAVKEFSLDISKGELVTLLGPSGCGKTTVLRMLAGFESPTTGDLFLAGKRINDLPPNARDSAMVFQSYALFPHMNVQQNILYGLKLRSVPKEKQKEKFDRIIEVVGLKGYETRRPNELSGGQQQRVALARALIVEPAILLFDEPLSNLDAKLRESMRNEIRRIQQSVSITAVYVTHDQSEAMAISDRVVVMNKAKIEQIGNPIDVYLKPSSHFVADFMGAANFIPVKVMQKQERSTQVQINQNYSIQVPNANANFPVGGDASLIVRPENIQMANGGAGLNGTVREHHYLGAFHEYSIQLENGNRLVARPSVRAGEGPKKIGDSVVLTLLEENVQLLPAQISRTS